MHSHKTMNQTLWQTSLSQHAQKIRSLIEYDSQSIYNKASSKLFLLCLISSRNFYALGFDFFIKSIKTEPNVFIIIICTFCITSNYFFFNFFVFYYVLFSFCYISFQNPFQMPFMYRFPCFILELNQDFQS